MHQPHVIIIGGGLAGLSAGCYARASGFRTTIVEHAAALGGVCTAWQRGAYLIDGCIRWLTGGPFERVYRELGILPAVELRTLDQLLRYRDVESGLTIDVTRDLGQLTEALCALAPEDRDEIGRLIEAARQMVTLEPGIDHPRELTSLRTALTSLWAAKHLARPMLPLQQPLSEYVAGHIESAPLRRMLTRLFPEDASALFLALMLGYLERGYLSRPVGGTAAFRDALIASYRALDGQLRLQATVEEVLVEHARARGVRLADGSRLEADYVISTSSLPETLLHLLGGRYGVAQHALKLDEWKMFGPLLLVSYGVARPLSALPSILLLDRVQPVHVGGRTEDHLSLRICNDEPAAAPGGHTVVQTLLTTDHAYWATQHRSYESAKQRIAASVLSALDAQLPGLASAVRMVDVATPLTYWRMARSWRGAYEGFQPSRQSLFGHVEKLVEGLSCFYLAGQWVEPGAGVPVALLSGRHAVQLLCAHASTRFVPGVA